MKLIIVLCCISFCEGHIPVIPLNYSVLSNEGPYSRDSFQLCIKEILLAMSRCLFAKKNVHLDFCDVGRLIVKDSKIQMKFFRNFIRQLDFNGDLESAFRPRTAQSEASIMTNPSPCREDILPKYVGIYNQHWCLYLPTYSGYTAGNYPILICALQWLMLEGMQWM